MAHKEQFTRAQLGKMFNHYDRTHITENVITDRTKDNYNLAAEDQPMTQMEFLNQRLSEVKVQNRKDVNLMVDWIVTAPKDLPQESQKAFFEHTYEFMKNRYGSDNVISAYVHMDETTPHMHYSFVPIAYDQKNDRLKVSAKEVITRKDLRTFHPELQNYLEKQLGHEVSILNEATKEGNKSIEELKRGSALKEIAALKQQMSKLEEDKQNLITEKKELMETIKPVKNARSKLEQIQQSQGRSLLGKVQLDQKNYDLLEKIALTAIKEKDQKIELERSYRSEKTNLEKTIDGLVVARDRSIQKNKRLEEKMLDLTKSKDSLSENRLVYRNILDELGYDLTKLTKIPELEWKSRYIIQSVQELGIPKNDQTKRDWTATLTAAKEQNLILKGLNEVLELLKKAVELILNLDRGR